MTVRLTGTLAVACGLWLACAVSAVEPKKPASSSASKPASTKATSKMTQAEMDGANQKLADQVASVLRASGVVGGADLRISTQNGIVELSGRTRTSAQANKIAETVLSVAGVKEVHSELKVLSDLELAQATEPAPAPLPNLAPPMSMPREMMPQGIPQGMQAQVAMNNGPQFGGAYGGASFGGGSEPMSMGGPGFPSVDQSGPGLPPNAWPTYAPYNNFSRVGYPEAYPYNAFPFIGPFYPFPKVPLGWRSVSLEWEDGHWYFGRKSVPHDYWKVRFW